MEDPQIREAKLRDLYVINEPRKAPRDVSADYRLVRSGRNRRKEGLSIVPVPERFLDLGAPMRF